MNFLADQDVYASTVAVIRGLGHDVVTAAQLAMSRADDSELLRIAKVQAHFHNARSRLWRTSLCEAPGAGRHLSPRSAFHSQLRSR